MNYISQVIRSQRVKKSLTLIKHNRVVGLHCSGTSYYALCLVGVKL